MSDGAIDLKAEARARAFSIPLAEINVAEDELYRADTWGPYFERLRSEAPVHRYEHPELGTFWSITRYHDIVAVDSNHQDFSSRGSIVLEDQADDFNTPMFIAMDPPKHDEQRKTVSPALSPSNLANMEPLIRERAGKILDELPVGEVFDWVDKVSIELTTMTLATLFDFPFEERRKLTRWSDVITAPEGAPGFGTEDERRAELFECVGYFTNLWNERVNAQPKGDLISMMAHSDATRHMDQMEFLGNLILLIVGGNDTTRNTISGSIVALNTFPEQYAKLKADPGLLPSMVSETIRWQTPLSYMRRTATRDVEMHGQTIRAGEKVAMWYISGNRDETVIENPNAYVIDRERPRQHVSFGFGIHRCVGNRLAELQLKVIWEEIMRRFPTIELAGEPIRIASSFIHGYAELPVLIPARN
ncbi:MAG TPA: cytochrome P450 [Caulobacteraceae bacterium]|nr:cytochrome P450 [Caulobacteraceae bacterium]